MFQNLHFCTKWWLFLCAVLSQVLWRCHGVCSRHTVRFAFEFCQFCLLPTAWRLSTGAVTCQKRTLWHPWPFIPFGIWKHCDLRHERWNWNCFAFLCQDWIDVSCAPLSLSLEVSGIRNLAFHFKTKFWQLFVVGRKETRKKITDHQPVWTQGQNCAFYATLVSICLFAGRWEVSVQCQMLVFC